MSGFGNGDADPRRIVRGDVDCLSPHHQLLFGGGKEKGAKDVLLYARPSKNNITMMCNGFILENCMLYIY